MQASTSQNINQTNHSSSNKSQSIFEFHISNDVRKKYEIEESLFLFNGNVIFPNFRSVRELAYKINQNRKIEGTIQQEIRAGSLNAMGLLDEISHFIVRLYDEKENPGAINRAFNFVSRSVGKEKLDTTLKTFLTQFPPIDVYKKKLSVDEYYSEQTSGRPHSEIALEEMMMLFLANFNPANTQFKELFDDAELEQHTAYSVIIETLEKYFLQEKPFGLDNQFLFEALKAPILSNPNSLEAQLGFFKKKWGIILSTKFVDRITISVEFAKEEENFIWQQTHGGTDGGIPTVETFVPTYQKKLSEKEKLQAEKLTRVNPEDYIYSEPEKFTHDHDWMPNIVIIAKNTYVWLDQLSKKYQREIKRLDQIPDAELDQLARWNFTGLWLIGVWERSTASKRIKQLTGNLDAVSSAYSLFEYDIAVDLGGEEAFQDLNRRAWHRGIRLAGDMVPNHMGLYSKWVIEHPEYFIQNDHPPYPNYKFTGHNLSDNPDVELRIEDGYWNRNDAAVVFQRIDKRNGEVRYIYHGNDGTNMPWNDTAQLNLLRADVREAIIQNILHVARKFSIIRFDAAMTLAKKHYQRLWYPMPGTTGVPSRHDHSLSRAEFDATFPNEFWREVVDRFNNEMPHTLLLAEAFWLMEGYFVRTLGMHRVYNSAFMHMMMKEENQKFRDLIKNTLEFNPEILKRYVNFMSNPDEQTAISQFGNGDKYFGVALMMVTLPGLPMFAHGQIEGFTEKYGMEYQRAYYDEKPDEYLTRRHELEIFPLMKKRYLFSQVSYFELYDFEDERGFVNENVLAFSNQSGNEKVLVFFHNIFSDVRGVVRNSVPKVVGDETSGQTRTIHVADSLGIKNDMNHYYLYREFRSNREYLRSGKEIWDQGFSITLRAFDYALFLDFREVYDKHGEYAALARHLQGGGATNLATTLLEIKLQPLHSSIKRIFEKQSLDHLFKAVCLSDKEFNINSESIKLFCEKVVDLSIESGKFAKIEFQRSEIEDCWASYSKKINILHNILIKGKKGKKYSFVQETENNDIALFLVLTEFTRTIHLLGIKQGKNGILVELKIDRILSEILLTHGYTFGDAQYHAQLITALARNSESFRSNESSESVRFENLFDDYATANFLTVHQHNLTWYFNKERFDRLISWLVLVSYADSLLLLSTKNHFSSFEQSSEYINTISKISDESEYVLDKFKELLLTMLPSKVPAIKEKIVTLVTMTVKKKISKTENNIKKGKKKKLKNEISQKSKSD